MFHSGPAKPHLPRSLRCCCLSAVSAYQVQLAPWADAGSAPAARVETSDKATIDKRIGTLPAGLPARLTLVRLGGGLGWRGRAAGSLMGLAQGDRRASRQLEACADRLSRARCCSAAQRHRRTGGPPRALTRRACPLARAPTGAVAPSRARRWRRRDLPAI